MVWVQSDWSNRFAQVALRTSMPREIERYQYRYQAHTRCRMYCLDMSFAA